VCRSPYTKAPGTGCASGPARLKARLIRDCSVPRVMRAVAADKQNS
jgi:hypothetical protein